MNLLGVLFLARLHLNALWFYAGMRKLFGLELVDAMVSRPSELGMDALPPFAL